VVQSSNFILNSITVPQGDGTINATYEMKGYLLRVVAPGGVSPGCRYDGYLAVWPQRAAD